MGSLAITTRDQLGNCHVSVITATVKILFHLQAKKKKKKKKSLGCRSMAPPLPLPKKDYNYKEWFKY